ncbi:MAG: Ig-like domain-containing protein, partial [Clostridia bacterium]|nr:Ig-like domain-containing protein [Clostridia bacterium]
MKKRVLSMFLAVVMAICLLPTVAFADSIAGPSFATVYIGQNYPASQSAVDFNSGGGGANTTSVEGLLPAGMYWIDVYSNEEVFRLSGTPQPGTAGIYTVTGTCLTDNSYIDCELTVAKGSQTICVDDGTSTDVSAITIPIGTPYTLNAYSVDGSGNKIDIATDYPSLTAADHQPSYTYASSNPGVATVDASGVVTPMSRGTTTITINSAATDSYNSTEKTISLTVKAQPTII